MCNRKKEEKILVKKKKTLLKAFWCLSCLCSITDLHRERSLRSILSIYVANIILAALSVRCFMLILSLPNPFLIFSYSLCCKLPWANCCRALHRRAEQEGLGRVMFLCLSCCVLNELQGLDRQKFCPPYTYCTLCPYLPWQPTHSLLYA